MFPIVAAYGFVEWFSGTFTSDAITLISGGMAFFGEAAVT
jgi:hypothetical protein